MAQLEGDLTKKAESRVASVQKVLFNGVFRAKNLLFLGAFS